MRLNKIIRHDDATTRLVDFGVADERGRAMGASLHLETYTVTDEEAPRWSWGTSAEPGTYFIFRPHATRDGKPYGACQREKWFPTPEAREAGIRQYLAGAYKRAPKRAATVARRAELARTRDLDQLQRDFAASAKVED